MQAFGFDEAAAFARANNQAAPTAVRLTAKACVTRPSRTSLWQNSRDAGAEVIAVHKLPPIHGESMGASTVVRKLANGPYLFAG